MNTHKERFSRLVERLRSNSGNPNFMAQAARHLKKVFVMMHGVLNTRVSVEIGAHEAGYSRELKAAYGDKIGVCAIEGSPAVHKHFSDRTDFKGEGIDYYNCVLSDVIGQAVFYEYFDDNADCASQISSLYTRDISMRGHAKRKSRVTVQSITGDAFLARKHPGGTDVSLFIDVEGAQQEVLTSFSQSFSEEKITSVFIEVEVTRLWPEQKWLANDVLDYLAGRGLYPFLLDNEYGCQFNLLCVHKNIMNDGLQRFYDYYLLLLNKAAHG